MKLINPKNEPYKHLEETRGRIKSEVKKIKTKEGQAGLRNHKNRIKI